MSSLPTNGASILAGPVIGRTAGRVSGHRVTRGTAVNGRTLHDDLDAVCLESALVERPPLTLWPEVEHRGRLPVDVAQVVQALAVRGKSLSY